MRRTVEVAEKHGLQIHTHLAETKDEENFCIERSGERPFAYMKTLGWIRPNAWFAHSIFLNDEEIKEAGGQKWACLIVLLPTCVLDPGLLESKKCWMRVLMSALP